MRHFKICENFITQVIIIYKLFFIYLLILSYFFFTEKFQKYLVFWLRRISSFMVVKVSRIFSLGFLLTTQLKYYNVYKFECMCKSVMGKLSKRTHGRRLVSKSTSRICFFECEGSLLVYWLTRLVLVESRWWWGRKPEVDLCKQRSGQYIIESRMNEWDKWAPANMYAKGDTLKCTYVRYLDTNLNVSLELRK